jgi:hypothetical protein
MLQTFGHSSVDLLRATARATHQVVVAPMIGGLVLSYRMSHVYVRDQSDRLEGLKVSVNR